MQKENSLIKNKSYQKSLAIGILLVIIAIVINQVMLSYTDQRDGVQIPDPIIDNLPTYNLFFIRTLIPVLTLFLLIYLCYKSPKKIPFMAKSIGLMYIVRYFFMFLLSLKSHPEKVYLGEINFFSSLIPYNGNDLFFSGHVALPFISALLFWQNKKVRNSFLILTFFAGIVTLLSKTHYSIDVFAAIPITYAVYKFSEKYLNDDFFN